MDVLMIILFLMILLIVIADMFSRKVLFPKHRTLEMSEKIVKDEEEWREDSSHFPHGWNQQAGHLPHTEKGQGR